MAFANAVFGMMIKSNSEGGMNQEEAEEFKRHMEKSNAQSV
jgi:hypothetical protein